MGFLLSAVRAVVEMLGLCLIAQAMLYMLAGSGREKNHIYRLFKLITAGPTGLIGRILPRTCGQGFVASLTFAILLVLWLLLAYLRRFV